MSIHENFVDYWLAITPRTGGRLLLSLYDSPPAKSAEPIASTVLPVLPYDRLGHALNHLLSGEAFAPQAVGDCLAEWLFVERPGAQPLYNPVGAYLHQQLQKIDKQQQLRVWICIDPRLTTWMEFQGYLPFECLSHNRILPLEVMR